MYELFILIGVSYIRKAIDRNPVHLIHMGVQLDKVPVKWFVIGPGSAIISSSNRDNDVFQSVKYIDDELFLEFLTPSPVFN